MPFAEPISILVTSNELKGRIKYCNFLAIGSSVSDFLYAVLNVNFNYYPYSQLVDIRIAEVGEPFYKINP